MRATQFMKAFALCGALSLAACGTSDERDDDLDREDVIENGEDGDGAAPRRYGGNRSNTRSLGELEVRRAPDRPSSDSATENDDRPSRSSQTPPAATERPTLDWYRPNRRGLRPEQVTPNSIPRKVRQAYQVRQISDDRENSFNVWASAWTRDGGSSGWALVEYLRLDAVYADGSTSVIFTQTYQPRQAVWGGWFPYSDQRWYRDGMVDENNFRVRVVDLPRGGSMAGAHLDTGRYTGRDLAAGHIWMMRWPRDKAPAGTVKLRVSARFIANGDALINVGLDRYRLEDADPEPEQECLVSDTYSASYGVVEVVMDTVPINWR